MTATALLTRSLRNVCFKRLYVNILFFLLFAPACLLAQTTITGKVIDQTGVGIAGASVYIRANSGTTTDKEGLYTLQTTLTGEREIIVSFVGYKTASELVTLNGGTVTIDFIIEQDAVGLNSVVVTATNTRRTQLTLPLSITTYNETKLQRVKYSSNADVLRGIPGISAENGGGEVASNIFVRGLPSGGQYQFTPLQFDGMPVISTMGLTSSAPDVYFRNDLGISRLEFVRGGSATLYGAGSVAGIVNYTSKVGTDVQQTTLETEYATPQRVRFDFNTGGPLSSNNGLYYNLTGMYRYDKGPIISGIPTNGYQFRGNIRKVMENGTFTVYGQYINDQVQFYSPYHLTADKKLPKGWDGDEIKTMETPDVVNLTVRTPNGFYQSHAGNGVLTKGGYVMADLQHNFSNDWKISAKLRNATYQHEFNFFNTDGSGRNPLSQTVFATTVLPAGSTAPVYTYANDNTAVPATALVLENIIVDRIRPMKEIAGQFAVSKTIEGGSTRQTITLGTFLSNTNQIDYNVQFRYLSEYKDRPRILNLRYNNATGTATNYTTNGVVSVPGYTNKNLTSRRAAVYLADEIAIGNLNIDAGFRYEAHSGRVLNEKTATAANTDGRNVAWGTGQFDRFDLKADDWAVALGLSYRVQPNMSVYGNFSRGYFFPEYRGYSIKITNGTPFYPEEKPEHILQGEAGLKFGNSALTATLAGFYVKLKDRYAANFLLVNGALKETQNLQSSRCYGVEATYDYMFVPHFHFSGNFTYQNAEYTLFVDSSNLSNIINNKGKWLERQPRVMFSPALSYDNRRFYASVTADYVGKRFGNAANLVELKPYTLVRVDLGYTFALSNAESFRISTGVFNLLNSEAVTEGNPRAGNAQTNTGDFFVGRISLPRAWYIRLGFNF
ncbi:MAG: TonB-dependent receptor [Flavisolibacter sp.]|nr:TonB-dependent receptor [Flavisolibacter sp.]